MQYGEIMQIGSWGLFSELAFNVIASASKKVSLEIGALHMTRPKNRSQANF